MSVIATVAFWGGIALAATIVVLFVALVMVHRYNTYEGVHRFDDDAHVISDAPPPTDYPTGGDS